MNIPCTQNEFCIKIIGLSGLTREEFAEYFDMAVITLNVYLTKKISKKKFDKMYTFALERGYYNEKKKKFFIVDYKNWGDLFLRIKNASSMSDIEFADHIGVTTYMLKNIFEGSESPNIDHLQKLFTLMESEKLFLAEPLRLSDTVVIKQ